MEAKNNTFALAVYELLMGTPIDIGLFDYLFVLPLVTKILCDRFNSRWSNNLNPWAIIIIPSILLSFIFFCVSALICIPLSLLILPLCWLGNSYYLSNINKLNTEFILEVLPIDQLLGPALIPDEDMGVRLARLPLNKREEIEKCARGGERSVSFETIYQSFYKSSVTQTSASNLQKCFGTHLYDFYVVPVSLTDVDNHKTDDFVLGLFKGTYRRNAPDVPTYFIVPCRENAHMLPMLRFMVRSYCWDEEKLETALAKENPFLKMAQNRARQQIYTALGIHHYTPKCDVRDSVLALMPEIMHLAGFGSSELQPSQLDSFVNTWSPRLFETEVPVTNGVFQSELSQFASNGNG